MFYSFLISIFFVFLYSFVFFLTSDTPLKYASSFGNIHVLSFLVFISIVLSVLPFSFIKIVGLIFSDSSKVKAADFLERVVIFTVLFFGLSLVAENWSYSVFGYGLKTSDTWVSKVLCFAVSIFLAFQFHPFFVWLGRKAKDYSRISIIVVVIFLLPFLINNLYRAAGNIPTIGVTGNIESEWNILILLSDGVSASEMSVYGAEDDTTPFLKSIESEFMVFENAFTNNQNSTGSVTSLLTGISPLTTKVVYPPDLLSSVYSKNSLPRLLGELGYYRSLWGVPHYVDADSQNLENAFDSNMIRTDEGITKIIENRPFIQRITERMNLSSLPAWYLRSFAKNHFGVLNDIFLIQELDNPYAHVVESDKEASLNRQWITDSVRVENILNDIDETAEIGLPFFSMMHLMKTHGSKFKPVNRVFSQGMEETEPWMLEFYRDAILDFDGAISNIYTKLKNTNTLEKTIIVVTSDHGMRWSNNRRIPLMIRLPNKSAAGRYNVNVQLLDVAPTILDAIGLSKPGWMEGQSLLDVKNVASDRYILSAGVTGNHISNGVWIRKEIDRSDFFTSNKFAAIHCDSFLRYSYPSEAKELALDDRYLDSGCVNESDVDVAGRVVELIESKIGNEQ